MSLIRAARCATVFRVEKCPSFAICHGPYVPEPDCSTGNLDKRPMPSRPGPRSGAPGRGGQRRRFRAKRAKEERETVVSAPPGLAPASSARLDLGRRRDGRLSNARPKAVSDPLSGGERVEGQESTHQITRIHARPPEDHRRGCRHARARRQPIAQRREVHGGGSRTGLGDRDFRTKTRVIGHALGSGPASHFVPRAARPAPSLASRAGPR